MVKQSVWWQDNAAFWSVQVISAENHYSAVGCAEMLLL